MALCYGMFEGRLEAIRTRVDRLRSRRGAHWSAFGVRAHRFEFLPPATPAELRRFELAEGVSIPPELRAFASTVGNGGAGPDYGILPVDSWNPLADLAVPSPLDPRAPRRADWMFHVPGGPEVDPYTGLLAFCSCGCTYWIAIVVTGRVRGRIVHLNEDLFCDPPYFTEEPDFLTWYERWLEVMEGAREPRTVAAIQSDPEMEERVQSAWLRYGFREPAVPDVDDLRRALHEEPAVELRVDAVSRLAGSTSERAIAAVWHALGDPALPVRRMAVRALWLQRRRGGRVFDQSFASLLDDEDPEIVQTAIFGLVERRRSNSRRLAALLVHPDAGVRGAAAFGLGWRGGEGASEALLDALGDVDHGVRMEAARGLGRLKDRAALASLRRRRDDEHDASVGRHVEAAIGESSRWSRRALRRRLAGFWRWMLEARL